LSVTPAALTITADNQSKAYGAALPTLTASFSGLVNGDTSASLTTAPTLSTTATASSHVGSYPITPAGAVAGDYRISYVDGTLSVTPAALTITADNQSKIYGAVLPTLTASYSGFVNGDTSASLTTAPTLSTTATAASHVGSYPITPAGAIDADYTISYLPGTLTVTPATPLPIAANDRHSATISPLAVNSSGFANGYSGAEVTMQSTVANLPAPILILNIRASTPAITSSSRITAPSDSHQTPVQEPTADAPAESPPVSPAPRITAPAGRSAPVPANIEQPAAAATSRRPVLIGGLFAELDRMCDHLDSSVNQRFLTALLAGGLTLSAGYVLWNIRALYLLASLLTAMPLMRRFDPLAVLAAWEKRKDEESLQSMLDRMPGE
jgi:hypothetical protein